MQSSSALALPDTFHMSMSAWHRSLDIRHFQDTTIPLTSVRQHGKLLGNKETHGIGDGKRNHLCTGMDAARESKEDWNAVSLRSQAKQACRKADGMALYRSCLEAGRHDQRRDISNPEQNRKQIGVIPKNDFRPPRAAILNGGP